MAVTFIPNTEPSYTCLSTDITAGSTISKGSYVGGKVYCIDQNKWYVIQTDLTLAPYYLPVPISSSGVVISGSVTTGSNVSIVGTPTVSISGNPTVLPVNPTVDGSFVGQIVISSSSVNTSGSTLSVSNAGGFLFKPHPNNSQTVWFNNHGATPSAGWPINVGDNGFLFTGSALSLLDFGVLISASQVICFARL